MDYSTVNKMFEGLKAISAAGCELSYELNNYESLIEKDKEARNLLYQMFSQNIDLDYEDCLSYEQKQKLRDLHAYLLPGVPRVMRSIIEEAIEDAINKARRIIEARETSQRYTKEFNAKQEKIDALNEAINEHVASIDGLNNKIQQMDQIALNQQDVINELRYGESNTLETNSKLKDHNNLLIKSNDEQQKIILDLQAQVKTLNEQLFGLIIEDDGKI